jgi:hypothetical protein
LNRAHDSGVVFPGGTEVRALPLRKRREADAERDFGLYCDERWAPTWPAEMIDWPDFGVPSDGETAAAQIRAAFARAQAGERVEVGCVGGLGRTGTVLACMALLAGVPAAAAVEWVRKNYDPRAVETVEQEEWLAWFATESSEPE